MYFKIQLLLNITYIYDKQKRVYILLKETYNIKQSQSVGNQNRITKYVINALADPPCHMMGSRFIVSLF